MRSRMPMRHILNVLDIKLWSSLPIICVALNRRYPDSDVSALLRRLCQDGYVESLTMPTGEIGHCILREYRLSFKGVRKKIELNKDIEEYRRNGNLRLKKKVQGGCPLC